MGKVLNAQQITEKWKQRASNAGTMYKEGIQAVNENPAQQAIEQQDKMLQKVTESVTSGRWARRLGNVTLESWKASAVNKGASNYTTGVQAGAPKMGAFMTAFVPHLNDLKAKLANMPRTSDVDMENRALEAIRHNRNFKNR